ncbi:Clp protease N-terminal domain-containing protein [Gordonia sp. zg691]|uniref:Clp protease N-terminal domain-containing protein n=1 Tax=Gordonia jinghuaiqii TaxID=2758710 RepID=A0A7D7LWC8_9ACTN|nr:Clp protease N-terminal domain-containing protein [Gordonia jinghuaiqii]MBD0863326.1 Clp protease N-terminal domain-containing protein [Gordonia jinghuaiqii]MCR5980162.1 ATP-dependent Clp protease ATP-binding subunit [Gordonia jinghuaiqii]QMT02075.1 Clp protease N-terminal domain-containing protein [Gordonia jinghuaiqii]
MPRNPPPIRLDDLITAIRTVHDDPLDQLADAVLAAQHLDEVADSLIGHFVDRARRSGASWTAIGARMGVSKQAAQKRFVDRVSTSGDAGALAGEANPFSRFTPRAANVLMAANSAAAADHAEHVTAGHIAQALSTEPQALVFAVLGEFGVDADTWSGATAPLVPAPRDIPAAEASTVVPYDDPAKAVLEATVGAAIDLGHNYVGTEHLLLGLFADEKVAEVLTGLGLASDAIRDTIVAALAQVTTQAPE